MRILPTQDGKKTYFYQNAFGSRGERGPGLLYPWNQIALLEQQLGLAPRNYGRMQDLFWMECFKGFLKLYELNKILSAKIRGSPVIVPLTSRMAAQVFQIEGIAMLIAQFELCM